MEASEVTATPPGAEEPAPAEPAPEPAAETQPEATPPVEPNVGEALSALEQRLGGIEQRLPAQEESDEGEGDEDFFTQFFGDEGELEGEEGEQGEQPQGQPTEADLLRQAIQEEARAALEPLQEQMEWDRRVQAVDRLKDKYPDLNSKESIEGIKQWLRPLGEQYGREFETHPHFIEMAYKAYKADAAAAAETPAEATGQGSGLEQGAGPGVAESEPALDEQITKALMGQAPTGDAFT